MQATIMLGSACMQGLWRRCSNSTHVASWEYVTLEPMDDFDDEEIDNPTYEGHHDALIDVLHIGDNFSIVTPLENENLVEVYLLRCT